VQYGRRAGSGAIDVLTGPHLSSGVGSEVLCARRLVGFWCEETCHAGSPDPSSDRDRTYPWNLACGAPLVSHLAEPANSWGVGPTPDPTSHLILLHGSAALACTESTLVPGH
jgi:hypothetical protein